MKRMLWPVIALVAVFALGAVTALGVTDHAEQRAVIRAQARTSAATTITLFLVVTIILVAGFAAAVGGAAYWLRRWGEREQMRKAAQQAQIYAMLQGARSPSPRRPAMPHQASPNILVFPQGQQAQLPAADWEVRYDE